MKYDYDSFKQQLLADLREFFPADTRISIERISHNNQLVLDGLTILEHGSNVSPTIYLERYFKQYEKDMDFPGIRQQILEHYRQYRCVQNIDVSFFTCLDKVRPRIAYKLIHYDRNRELLEGIPHFAYLDLAIVFYYLAPGDTHENASILIHNSHLSYWDISKDHLLLFAQQNTPQLLPSRYQSLKDLLLPALDVLPEAKQPVALELMDNTPPPMYVLTNTGCYLGACCILYPDVLKEISGELGGDLILLPSSIHEFILMPASLREDPDSLRGIVREVNLTAVAPEEFLSDSIYYYDCQTDQVSLLCSE